MSILSRLKNKLQDPVLNETKVREYDECISLLKNENVELHKRLDQLEALCKTNITTQQTHSLDEHIRELEHKNGRLLAENQYQRQEYERFLHQLTTTVMQTAIMQENIRKECASIYHVIERLAHLPSDINQIHYPFDLLSEARNRFLNKTCEFTTKNQESSSSSSSSSLTTHCSVSTSNSWTLDLTIKNRDTEAQFVEGKQLLQRSETFIISKAPLSPPIEHQPMVLTTPTIVRPSKLPSHCSNAKTSSSNSVNNNRSISTPKVSKLPIRTNTNLLNRQQISPKKSNIPTPVLSKTKTPNISNRSITSVNNSTINKITPLSSNNTRSRSIITSEKKAIQSPLNKCPRTTIETVKSNGPIQQINSTSSESSIEEQQQYHMNKLLPILQDEGYSTWSSIDVKDDVIKNNIEKNENDNRQKNIGLVKNWLDTSNRPVKQVELVKLEEFNEEFSNNSLFLCPFVRNRCSNGISIPLPSSTISCSNKDISLDSLDSPQSREQTITSSLSSSSSSTSSSATFSRSETFEKLLNRNIIDDLTDSTSSTSSTFNMPEFIEDHFIDQDDDDDTSSENSSSYETTIRNKYVSLKPQKRLLFPGTLNRLIFFRRILSDSDLQRKDFSSSENENSYHVYHSNIINEHSVEVNLINTYGSDSELHVWSHDCAEQRRFLNERQQQQQLSDQIEENKCNSNHELALERQILLQQICEYPWLSQENDLDRTNIQISPTSDLIVPSHNPDFYQLCTLPDSTSFIVSYDPNARHSISPTASTVL